MSDLMPKIYPMGYPINSKDLTVNGMSIDDRFSRICNDLPDNDDKRFCRDYIAYYMNSPLFTLPNVDLQAIWSMDFETALDTALSNGLDPF